MDTIISYSLSALLNLLLDEHPELPLSFLRDYGSPSLTFKNEDIVEWSFEVYAYVNINVTASTKKMTEMDYSERPERYTRLNSQQIWTVIACNYNCAVPELTI